MEKLYDCVKDAVVNFKLQRCCCVAPIRIGLLIVGYFNIFIALLWLVDTADSGTTPPLMAVQTIILEDNASKAIGILAYSTELSFNTILLCGVYRNDMVLLRMFTYFVFLEVITSVLVYSIVFATTTVLLKMHIMWNIGFQCYVLILVRSAIVEIKEMQSSEKNGHVTLYSVVQKSRESELPPKTDSPDIEAAIKVNEAAIKVNEAAEPGPSEVEDIKNLHSDEKKPESTKLETVNENTKEE